MGPGKTGSLNKEKSTAETQRRRESSVASTKKIRIVIGSAWSGFETTNNGEKTNADNLDLKALLSPGRQPAMRWNFKWAAEKAEIAETAKRPLTGLTGLKNVQLRACKARAGLSGKPNSCQSLATQN